MRELFCFWSGCNLFSIFAERSLIIPPRRKMLIKKGGGTEPCETLATISTLCVGGRC